jgi:hypothetical protein
MHLRRNFKIVGADLIREQPREKVSLLQANNLAKKFRSYRQTTSRKSFAPTGEQPREKVSLLQANNLAKKFRSYSTKKAA